MMPVESIAFSTNQEEWPKISTFKSLNADEGELRLLKSNTFGARLQYELVTTRLADAPTYYALSYVWGQRHGLRWIEINGEQVEIRVQVYEFLENLNQILAAEPSMLVWIDVLCVDQGNISERSRQVKMMGDIYGAARATYAWLGSSDAETIAAMKYIVQEQTTFDMMEDDSDFFPMDDPVQAEYLRQGWSKIIPALSNSYWTRVWILQELALSQQIFLMCGDEVLSFSQFQRAISYLAIAKEEQYSDRRCQEAKRNSAVVGAMSFIRRRQRRVLLPLQTAVRTFRNTQCLDRRDHIYGVLALIKPEHRKLVKVDYTFSEMQLFMQIMSTIPYSRAQTWVYTAKAVAQSLRLVVQNCCDTLEMDSMFRYFQAIFLVKVITAVRPAINLTGYTVFSNRTAFETIRVFEIITQEYDPNKSRWPPVKYFAVTDREIIETDIFAEAGLPFILRLDKASKVTIVGVVISAGDSGVPGEEQLSVGIQHLRQVKRQDIQISISSRTVAWQNITGKFGDDLTAELELWRKVVFHFNGAAMAHMLLRNADVSIPEQRTMTSQSTVER